ncbi:MAG: MerR family transcriptional regulator [Anaerolineae bacterium]
MLIGQLAKAAGVSKDTVRYYERMGLIESTARQAGSRRYAEYDPKYIQVIRDIKEAQTNGFSLKEMLPFVSDYFADSIDKQEILRMAQDKLAKVERQRTYLLALIKETEAEIRAQH